ncbi:MAG TPA: cation-translocating P-type ATPase C-terminal domain-containing protein, partial [Gemmatimonadales bacterium]|nr:cation-translocating P-type ATPase C-terminal domain-containing protein [Gemmatimonadales bacterium]
LGNARSVRPVLSPATALSNLYAVGAVIVTVTLQVLTVTIPPLAEILRTHPLGGIDWLVLGGLALLPAVLGQTIKGLRAARENSPGAEPE